MKMVLIQDYFEGHDWDKDFETRVIKNLRSKEITNRKGRLYASDSAFCHKQSVLNSSAKFVSEFDASFPFYTGLGKEAETILLKKGLSGNDIEILFEDYRIPDIGINLGGKVDAIVKYKDLIWVLEVKQVGTIPKKPRKKDAAQAMIYSAITGLPSMVVYLTRGVANYKDELEIKMFELDSCYENRFKYLNRAVLSHLHNKNKVIPNVPTYRKKSHCSFCHWYFNCWDGEALNKRENHIGDFIESYEYDGDLYDESTKITNQLLNVSVVKSRFSGVLHYFEKYGRETVKSILVGEDWNKYFIFND